MLSAESLSLLKKKIGAVEGTLAKKTTSFSLYSEGIPLGALVEIVGRKKTEFISMFLKENHSYLVAWIEKTISINPYALWQRGVAIENILFVECDKEPLWTIREVIKCQLFQVIILSQMEFTEKDLRKFQLLIEKTESHLILLSPKPQKSWAVKFQINSRAVS